MINNADYYRRLVTSEYRHSPKFTSMVNKLVGYGIDADAGYRALVLGFDIDNAVGAQLDVIGDIVGQKRWLDYVPTVPYGAVIITCPQVEEFPATGVEIYQLPEPEMMDSTMTIYQGIQPAAMIVSSRMPDDVFRPLLKAKVIANLWKGTADELRELWAIFYGRDEDGSSVQIQDLQDMTYNVILVGNFSAFEQELIQHGYLLPKPEGVRINTISFITPGVDIIFCYQWQTPVYDGYGARWLFVGR